MFRSSAFLAARSSRTKVLDKLCGSAMMRAPSMCTARSSRCTEAFEMNAEVIDEESSIEGIDGPITASIMCGSLGR